MSLARKALAPRQIVPAVYGWGSAADDNQGWILMEHMRGTPLDAAFDAMSSDDQSKSLKELAGIVRALQQYELPESIQEFGGLDFDHDGKIVSAQLTVFACGPFTTYPMLINGILYEQLAAADKSPIVRGWRDKGTRAKLERFITEDVDRMLQSVNTEKKRLVHGDFSTSSCLIPIAAHFSCSEMVD